MLRPARSSDGSLQSADIAHADRPVAMMRRRRSFTPRRAAIPAMPGVDPDASDLASQPHDGGSPPSMVTRMVESVKYTPHVEVSSLAGLLASACVPPNSSP